MNLTRMTCVILLGLLLPAQGAMGATVKDIQAQGTAMMKDAEDMVAHGGMGDTKAIVHHCRELSRHAEAILSALPPADPQGQEASPHLLEAIKQCRRVVELGDKVDPGASLNPAIKARAAAREAVKHLGSLREGGA
jgi:Small metal-binding protein